MGNQALRTSSDWNEIIGTLEEIQSEGSPVAIWETGGEKTVERAVSWSLDLDNGQIDFHQKGSNFNHLKDKNTTVYFKGKEKSILFKQGNILPLGDHILIDIPNEVNLYDRRGEERILFGWGSPHFARLTFTRNGKDYDLIHSIYDISPNGLALNLSPSEVQFFKSGDIIHIHKVGQSNLMIPLKAEICHIGHMDFIEGGIHFKRMKVGIRFKKDLNLLCFSELFDSEKNS
tara:strand:- start:18000 stop:18692 length:693 start_codon:yes stop_codon:yes gene_type:complete